MSMAAGEYVSVSSQSDTEHADLARERKELSENVEFERVINVTIPVAVSASACTHKSFLQPRCRAEQQTDHPL